MDSVSWVFSEHLKSAQVFNYHVSVVASSPRVVFHRTWCRNTKANERGVCVCALSVSMVTISAAGVSTKCGVRTRKADARWCMCGPRGSCARSGTVTPPLSLCPTPFSAVHTYIRVRGVC